MRKPWRLAYCNVNTKPEFLTCDCTHEHTTVQGQLTKETEKYTESMARAIMSFFAKDRTYKAKLRRTCAVAVPALAAPPYTEISGVAAMTTVDEIRQLSAPDAWGPREWFDYRLKPGDGWGYHQCRLCDKQATAEHFKSIMHHKRVIYATYYVNQAEPIGKWNRDMRQMSASGPQTASNSGSIPGGTYFDRPPAPPLPQGWWEQRAAAQASGPPTASQIPAPPSYAPDEAPPAGTGSNISVAKPDAIDDPQFVPVEYSQQHLQGRRVWLQKSAALVNEIVAAQAMWGANGLMQWLDTVMLSERWCKLPNTYQKVYAETFKKLKVWLHPDKLIETPDLCRMAQRIRDKMTQCEHYLRVSNRCRMQHQMMRPANVDDKIFEILRAKSQVTHQQDEEVAKGQYASAEVSPGTFVASQILTAAESGQAWQPPFVANNGHVEFDDDPWQVPGASGPQAASATVTTPVISPAASSGTTVIGATFAASDTQTASPGEPDHESSKSSWGHLAGYDFVQLLNGTGSFELSDGGVFDNEKQKVVYQFTKVGDHYSFHQSPDKLFWNPHDQAWTKYSVHCGHGPYENPALPPDYKEWRTYDGRRFFMKPGSPATWTISVKAPENSAWGLPIAPVTHQQQRQEAAAAAASNPWSQIRGVSSKASGPQTASQSGSPDRHGTTATPDVNPVTPIPGVQVQTAKDVDPFKPGADTVQKASQSASAAQEAAPEAPSEETPIAEKDDDGVAIPAIVLELKFNDNMSEADKAQHMTEWQKLRSEISTDFNGKIRKQGNKGSENSWRRFPISSLTLRTTSTAITAGNGA